MTRGEYPGDYTGPVNPSYNPELDGDPDPGEIVWGWIPYQDDHSKGKDRPVLVIERQGDWAMVLILSSQDQDDDAGALRRGEVWLEIGSGDWDAERRPSQVRIDRIVRLRIDQMRREGAILDRPRFDVVASAVRAEFGSAEP